MSFLIAFLQSLIYQYLTIHFEKSFGFFIDPSTKLHAIHTTPTPRVGGIGIFLAFCISIFLFLPQFYWLVLSSAIIFGFGLYEDWHGDTKKEYRLIAMALATYIAIHFSGYVADNSEFFILPYAIAVLFTIFAVVGMSSAINFIDGLNGLASGTAIITFSSFALLSFYYEDTQMLSLSLIAAGSTVGFFIWNYPKGKIFLGDGGAYFLGFLLAMLSIMLSSRHDEISLWYTLIALSYPVIETFVTIKRRIRRKKKFDTPFFDAERVHLHTLKFRRITKCNSSATRRLLIYHFFINIAAIVLHASIIGLVLLLFIAYKIYINKYRRIIRFGNQKKFHIQYKISNKSLFKKAS